MKVETVRVATLRGVAIGPIRMYRMYILGLMLLAAGCGEEPPVPSYSTVPDFRFIDQEGSDRDGSMLDGRITVVDFIFTTCAGICPVMSHTMSGLQQEFRGESDVRFLSMTVDPETDTPPVLREYAARYDAAPGTWTFLTGHRDSIYALIREGFKLGIELEGDDAILHSQKFVLVDRSRTIRGWYDSDLPDEMTKLKRDIRRLVDHK